MGPALAAWEVARPRLLGAGLLLVIAIGASGFHPKGLVYLSSSQHDSAGIADHEGFWFYSFTERTVEHSDLAQRRPPQRWPAGDPAVTDRVARILALDVTANTLIERNALWSWPEFGDRL